MTNKDINSSVLPRRSLLKGALGVGALAAVGPNLVAASNGSAATLTSKASGTPVQGGTLRVAIQGTSQAFSILSISDLFDGTVQLNAFDGLTRLVNGKRVFQVAESITPNADATLWTINVRQGIKFHDGTPLTSADVVYSLQQIANPKISGGAAALSDMNAAGIQATGPYTVTLPLNVPRSDWVSFALTNVNIFPTGTTDFSNPIGSGPFILQSYTSTGATMTANPNYWGGAPYLSGIELSNIVDPQARYNAVQSGEVDYAVGISATSAATAKGSGISVVEMPLFASIIMDFIMNPAKKPFNNPKVREAFRLAMDREALFKSALFSRGEVGYDVPGMGYAGYDSSLARTVKKSYNPKRAKKLFKETGVKEVTMRVSDIAPVPGLVSGAELYAEQLKKVGVTLHLDMIPPADWFANFALIESAPFQVYSPANQLMSTILCGFTGPTAYFPLGNPTNPAYAAQMAVAQKQTNQTVQNADFNKVASALVQDGGHMMWGYGTPLNAQKVNLKNPGYSYGGIMDLRKAWMQ